MYWGTIHNQNSMALTVEQKCTKSFCFGVPANPREQRALNDGVYRSTSFWRGRNLEDPRTREIQLLYGESQLPVCCSAPKTFGMQPTGWTPLYGPSGFGNRGNEYTWTMTVYDNRLFIGTYDASILQGPSTEPEYGADLWRIDSSDSPAVSGTIPGSATSATTASARCMRSTTAAASSPAWRTLPTSRPAAAGNCAC